MPDRGFEPGANQPAIRTAQAHTAQGTCEGPERPDRRAPSTNDTGSHRAELVDTFFRVLWRGVSASERGRCRRFTESL
jgi:hypothetical protein